MPIVMSCAVDVTPCDDTTGQLGLPGDVLGPLLLGGLLAAAAIVALAIRTLRRRPPWQR